MPVHHVRRGTGEPLLLVHGIGDTHRMWTPVLDRLAARHEVFAVDVPGFGRSPALAERQTIQAMAATLRGLMAEHEPFHVAGDSMGGAIALELARTGAARSATALSPSGFAIGWERTYAKASLLGTRAGTRLLAPYADRLTRTRTARRLLAGQMVRDGAHYGPEDLAATMRDMASAPALRRTLRATIDHHMPAGTTFPCPVTIAWGTHDYLLLTGRQAPRARERLPTVNHVTLQDCGHVPTWDDPELVAGVIEETIAAATPRQPRPPGPAPAPASPRR
jgi:pimeloyl-ACP methyl ester carboxylesterase